MLTQLSKKLINLKVTLGRHLNILVQLILLHKSLRQFSLHFSTGIQILLSPRQKNQYIITTLRAYFIKPVLHILKTLHIINGVCKNTRVRITIKDFSYRPEIFLPRRIPYLHLDHFVVDFDHVRVELDTDGDLSVHKFVLD